MTGRDDDSFGDEFPDGAMDLPSAVGDTLTHGATNDGLETRSEGDDAS